MQGSINDPRDLGEGQNQDYGSRDGEEMELRST